MDVVNIDDDDELKATTGRRQRAAFPRLVPVVASAVVLFASSGVALRAYRYIVRHTRSLYRDNVSRCGKDAHSRNTAPRVALRCIW